MRYARVRDGTYLPLVKRFMAGDFVYVRRQQQHMLELPARPLVLKVHAVRASGVLVLVGRCGRLIKVHQSHVAPCHLSDIHDVVDPTLVQVGDAYPCTQCQLPDHEELMLLCDCCGAGWHTYCLQPPLSTIPVGNWFCPDCQPVVVAATVCSGPACVVPVRVPAVSAVPLPAQLPDAWDLCSADGVQAALDVVMPGKRTPARLGRLAAIIGRGLQCPAALPNVPTLLDEVRCLQRYVNVVQCTVVGEPFAGTGGISAALRGCGLHVVTNDLNPVYGCDMVKDAMQPGFYRGQGWDAVVTSPWFGVLDLLVPMYAALQLELGWRVVCIHVPGHYVCDPTPYRRRFFRALQGGRRMVVLLGAPKGPMGRRCAWFLLFPSYDVQVLFMHPSVQGMDLVFVDDDSVG